MYGHTSFCTLIFLQGEVLTMIWTRRSALGAALAGAGAVAWPLNSMLSGGSAPLGGRIGER